MKHAHARGLVRRRPPKVLRISKPFSPDAEPLPEVVIEDEGYDKVIVTFLPTLAPPTYRDDGDVLIGHEETMCAPFEQTYFPAVASVQRGKTQYRRKDIAQEHINKMLRDESIAVGIFERPGIQIAKVTGAMRGDGRGRIRHVESTFTHKPIDDEPDERYLGNIEDQFQWD